MAKRKIVLMYDEATTELSGLDGNFIMYWSLVNPQYLDEQPKQDSTLDKLTKLRSMNLSVDEIRDLKDMGLLD